VQLASSYCAAVPLGSILQRGVAIEDEQLSPIVTTLNGVVVSQNVLKNSLSVTDTLGQPVTMNCMMVNLAIQAGDVVRVTYFAEVIFSGTFDHAEKHSPDLRTFLYQCDALDWSQALLRRRLRRNFVNETVQSFVDSLLDNELNGEGLAIGTIDTRAVFPLIDSKNAKIFDALRTVAGASGQTFYVGYDKTIQMRSTTAPIAPLVLDESHVLVDGMSVKFDRETYRNRQTVIVTGTPQTEGETALSISADRQNDQQIADRKSIEGGTGLYEEIESVTHPTSNDPIALTLMAIAYANLRLSISGTTRAVFICDVYGYGFRAGQVATVALPTFGLTGDFYIQKVSIREVNGRFLRYSLELTNTSLQQRAYEAWLAIVGAGKVTVQIPSAFTNNLETFDTPGVTTWTVPPGITLAEFRCLGASAGAGGGAHGTGFGGNVPFNASGGNGGNSGLGITTISVVEGQVFDLVIGSAGLAGANASLADFVDGAGSNGTDGTVSSVSLSSLVVAQGNPGLHGTSGYINPEANYTTNGVNGLPGSGVGDAVSVGGGKTGGIKGTGNPYVQPTSGKDGLIEIRY
jgi:hypothetical protein